MPKAQIEYYVSGACMHYHGIDVESVGSGCPPAWVDAANKVECGECDSFRYRIALPKHPSIEILTREYPTAHSILFSVAFKVLSKAT